MPISSAVFSIADTTGAGGAMEAGCRATLALVDVPQYVQLVTVVLLLSSSLTAQLVY